MYEIAKISVNAQRQDVYDYKISYQTWEQMAKDLEFRRQHSNEVFSGRGSAILRDGQVIGHSRTMELIDAPESEITLTEFLAKQADEDANVPNDDECGLGESHGSTENL